MNTTSEHAMEGHEAVHLAEESRELRTVMGGSVIEAIGGIGAVVLTILGLADVLPTLLTAIAVIVIGASFLFEGTAIGSRFSRLWSAAGGGVLRAAELSGGMTAEFLGGAAGVVLGILALLDVAPIILTSVAAIVFGGALLLGSGALTRLNYLDVTSTDVQDRVKEIAREALAAATGAQVLVGMAAVILGILALVGFSPLTLTMIALLCVSGSALVSGAALSGRLALLGRK